MTNVTMALAMKRYISFRHMELQERKLDDDGWEKTQNLCGSEMCAGRDMAREGA